MPDAPRLPTLGYILIGGPLVGSRVRDVFLANELCQRGAASHVWWAMDWTRDTPLLPEIGQHWLFHSVRNAANLHGPSAEALGRLITKLASDARRTRLLQKRAWFLRRQMRHLVERVCQGVETDPGLLRRFARQMDGTGVEHLFPNLAIFAPYVEAARRLAKAKVRYTVTFQGYELYSRYAREIGLEKVLFQRLRDAVEASDTPAVAVSEDYRQRVHDDIGVPLDRLVVIPPGIPEEPRLDAARAQAIVAQAFPERDASLPLISYVGRQDSEKGIDLLLYAAKLLRQRPETPPFQLAVAGGTAFGGEYATVLRHLADQLSLPVLWHGSLTLEQRTALYQVSHATVYPSVHREPFGMVPVECMRLGTPAVVSDTGGVAELVQAGGVHGGLTFRSWDSADLATQLGRLLAEPGLRAKLSQAAPSVAARYSVARLGDRTLNLIAGRPLEVDPLSA